MTTDPWPEPAPAEQGPSPTQPPQWKRIAIGVPILLAMIAVVVVLVVAPWGHSGWSNQRVADDINRSLKSDPNATPGAEPPVVFNASQIPALLSTYCPILKNQAALLAHMNQNGLIDPGSPAWETNVWLVSSIQAVLTTSGRCPA